MGEHLIDAISIYEIQQLRFLGTVKVWDPRQKEKPVASMEPFDAETRRDCWAVGFGNSYNNSERIVCAGYDNGDLKMFDLRTMSLRWECNLKNGVNIIFLKASTIIFVRIYSVFHFRYVAWNLIEKISR